MKKLSDLFYGVAEKYPDKIAICCDNINITYEELANLVSKYSNLFLKSGIKYKENIATPMNNSIESVALILAAANIGVAIVPFNPTLSMESIQNIFKYANIKHIIANSVFFKEYILNNKLTVRGSSICIDAEYENVITLKNIDAESSERPIISEVTGEETLIITMTSGSTGNPKPIDLTQNNKVERALAHIELYKITKEDNILACTPLYHSLAERLVLIPLIIGAKSILMSRFTPNMWIECVKSQNVTFTIAVSAQLNQIKRLLSNEDIDEFDKLRCVVSSSALLEESIKEELIEKLHCDFHEMYGTSETSTITSINFAESKNKRKSVGKALSEADIRIINENDEEVESNIVGEIACKTSLMCNEYYKMKSTFNSQFCNGYFKTGDLGYLDDDGYLYFAGRKKELIITGGINVYPPDIENCVLNIKEIKECAAFPYPDDRLGEIVALAVVADEGKDISKRTIQRQCAKKLADYQQPHKIFILDELPKNAMGKIEKYKILNIVQDKQK